MPVAAQERHQRDRKKVCAQEFAPALEAELDRFVAPRTAGKTDLEALESYVRRQALQLAARAVERRLNADLTDGEPRPRPCICGRRARYAGRFPNTFETVLGPLTLERAYFHCQARGKGFCPRDQALGLEGTSLSPAVTRMTGSAAALASFRQASGLLSELAGRAGKEAHGSARTREAKLIVIWTAERLDEDCHAVCDAGSTTYSAAIDSAASRDTDPEQSASARCVWREAERRGFPRVERRVILGDGKPVGSPVLGHSLRTLGNSSASPVANRGMPLRGGLGTESRGPSYSLSFRHTASAGSTHQKLTGVSESLTERLDG